MSTTTSTPSAITVLAPLTGRAVALDQVPDPVFSEKALGDGAAIIPTDGRIYSPVNGEVASVAPTNHAFGFTSDDGLDILVHVGLETVALKGEGFTVKVKEGDRVKAGDLIAVVDLKFLAEKNINPITPVILCDGAENMLMTPASGNVSAGKDPILMFGEQPEEAAAAAETDTSAAAAVPPATTAAAPLTAAAENSATKEAPASSPAKTKKPAINFDFLQKLGKVLMTVIAVMPAAGIMLSIGKLLQMAGTDFQMLITIGSTMENIGWAIITNLHILFAAAIGGSWAKERAGGAFAAVIAFILINRITGSVFGVTNDMLANPDAVVTSLFGQEMLVSNYFTSILGSPALNMGVFIGIISGFVGGIVYNKYYNFRKLPDALSFFNGKRFVPMAVIAYSVVISMVMAVIWPVVQTGINSFGVWIANSSSTSPVLAPFIYGTLERLLLPFGLHHMLTIPMNYTSFGGTYTIQTGISAGS